MKTVLKKPLHLIPGDISAIYIGMKTFMTIIATHRHDESRNIVLRKTYIDFTYKKYEKIIRNRGVKKADVKHTLCADISRMDNVE